MRSLFAILLLPVMFIQTFHMGITEVDFFINQDRIADELCENKAEPELECHGTCQLKKELEKQDATETTVRQVREIQLFLNAENFSLDYSIPEADPSYGCLPIPALVQAEPGELFHPPTC
ncbi:MAG: hypothetical protein J5I50_02730 [Chitinophagaceae bacterium]|nr:hypothetical protein [Chitinophagaceae bacterium]